MLVTVRRAPVRLLAACSFAFALSAQEAATVAKLVQAPTVDAAPLATALGSADPVTRATAARVALVRGVDALLPPLREVLAKETNAEAAREEVRALALLGSEEDVAFAVKQLPRFSSSIDLDFSEAIARRGAPEATTLYLRHRGELRLPAPYITNALWGRASQATATASRLLGANDAAGFRSLLSEVLGTAIDIDAGVIAVALAAPSPEVRTDTVWYLIERYAVETEKVPESAGVPYDGMTASEAFGREVLRRMRGAEFVEKAEWLAWLRSPEGRGRAGRRKPVLRHLSLKEQKALNEGEKDVRPDLQKMPGQDIPPAPFVLAISLPAGLSTQLLQQAGCPGSWVGSANVTVDRAGRVQAVALGNVLAPPACGAVLDTMLRLTLADPRSVVAPMASTAVQLVASREQPCLDEGPLFNGAQPGASRFGGKITPPKLLRRVEPEFPAETRKAMGGPAVVVVETLISRTACVRDIHVIKQSPWPQLNTSAVIAVSKWKFEPGMLDGQPVDVLFDLTVNFKPKH
jgi:TonB family protein